MSWDILRRITSFTYIFQISFRFSPFPHLEFVRAFYFLDGVFQGRGGEKGGAGRISFKVFLASKAQRPVTCIPTLAEHLCTLTPFRVKN